MKKNLTAALERSLTRQEFLKLGGVGLAGAALLGTAGCGARGGGADGGSGGGKKFTIKLSHVVTADTPKGKASDKFKKLVEKKSDGKIKVEVYPNSELYGDEDELQALQSGSVQMLAPSSAKFTTIAPQLQVLDLPFIFDSVDDIPDIVSPDSNVGKAIFENKKLASKNIKVLGLWDNGLKQLSSNKEMLKPEALKGLKFRIQPSDVLRSQFKSWGANSTPMAFSEVYNALQQGVIDGAENPYSNIESQNMQTVQKHISESDHGYIGYVLTINNDFYNKLPDDLKKVVTDSAKEASTYNREIAADLNQKSKEKIEKGGKSKITKLSDSERQAFKDAVVPSVWKQYSDVIGKDLVDELLKKQG